MVAVRTFLKHLKKCFKYTINKIIPVSLALKLFDLPVTELSFMLALHNSILAECQGTYRSCVEPASNTCLNMCRFDLSLEKNSHIRRIN